MARGLSLSLLLLLVIQNDICGRVGAARVLFLSALQRSHFSQMMGVAEELVNRGHEAFVLVREDFAMTEDELKFASAVTYKKVDPSSETMVALAERSLEEMISPATQGWMTMISSITRMLTKTREYCQELTMENEDAIAQLQDLNLDFALVDYLPMGHCYHLLACRLGLRTATLTGLVEPWALRLPWLPSHVPNQMLQLSDDMTFWERIKNTFAGVFVYLMSVFAGPPRDLVHSYSPYCQQSIASLISRSELFLYTSDEMLDTPLAVTPNVVLVGGLTLKPAKPLPPDLEEALVTRPKDIVLVTMGSIVSNIGDEFARKFISAFEQLPQLTFIWRFRNDNNLTLPPNVIARKWLPQGDIMGHARVKVFVSHCGRNGLYEAIYNGVPIVALPFFGDQPRNAFMAARKGYGIKLNALTFTSENLRNAVSDVASNATYRDAIQKASAIFRSHPETPCQKAARMLDHVIQYGGSHLRSHAYELNFFQFWLLDVMAFLVVVVSASCYLCCRLCRCLCRSVRNKAKKGKRD